MSLNRTSLVRPLFRQRLNALSRYTTHTKDLQREVLQRLLQRASATEYGRRHGFARMESYANFHNDVPLNSYEELKDYIDRMRHGESDLLWPGQVKWYAKSSGTTNDKSKFIPVSKEGLDNIHYRGGKDTVGLYLRINPNSCLMDGKSLILGGSHSPNYNLPNSIVGDLSAILIENMWWYTHRLRVPSKHTALLSDFEVKREQIVKETLNKNVTSLSGVPSWMLSVLLSVLEKSGKRTLDEVWPNLGVFFHGGISFSPYRKTYEQLIRSSKMHYMETYNASEGFFGIQSDLSDPAMLLMIDYDIFYEFIPMDTFHDDIPVVVPLSDVEIGKNYAMVISTSCGLWRYIIGDTVKFTQKDPYKFVITGRTKHYINAFGEELIVDNAEKALAYVCEQTNAEVRDYTAAPIFMDQQGHCRHQWLLDFAKKPDDMGQFATMLDRQLQHINSDYEAKRYKDITLQPLEIIVAQQGLFDMWLKSKGKLGGQHKVPRLANNRQIIDELLLMNADIKSQQGV